MRNTYIITYIYIYIYIKYVQVCWLPPSFTRFDGSKPSKIRDIFWLRYKYTPMISHDSITYHNTSVRYHCYLWTYTPKNRGVHYILPCIRYDEE